MPRQEDTPMHETPRVDHSVGGYQERRTGGEGASQATQAVRETTQSAQQAAGQFVQQGRERVTTQLGDQKTRLVGGLGSASEAIRSTGEHLREQEQGGVAQLVDQGANQLDNLSRYLQNRDVDELLREAESLARQRPAVVMGAAFGLGLLAARFLKSSGQQAQSARY